jgi:hypothetical protein
MDAVANSTLLDSDADAGARAPPTERIQFGNIFASFVMLCYITYDFDFRLLFLRAWLA